MKSFDFPVGYYDLHKIKIIDYQLNRWHSLGYTSLAEMREAAAHIKTLDDWKAVMVRLAENALADGRLLNATFNFRAAEFFTHPTDPDKKALYDRFLTLFYDELFANEPLERFQIPYGDACLSGYKLPAQGEVCQGTMVIHGGFDSFIEELFSIGCFFANRGYDVILFDGPGQGRVLKEHHLPITYAWEKPAQALLDFFALDDVTWLGISMGGWLCFRAAAFEPRIKRVIALSIAYDYMKIPPDFVAGFARWLMRHERVFNLMSGWKMKMMPQEKWGIDNLMYITQTNDPLTAARALLEFNQENLKSDLVKQDVLILSGAEDHFIPLKLHHLQVAALAQARSVTDHIFTRADQAQNHCQVGNIGLALEAMAGWLAEVTPAPAAVPQSQS